MAAALSRHPATYWDGHGSDKADARYQRSQPSMLVALVGEYLPEKEEGEVEIAIIRADDDAPLLFQVDDGDWQEKGDI